MRKEIVYILLVGLIANMFITMYNQKRNFTERLAQTETYKYQLEQSKQHEAKLSYNLNCKNKELEKLKSVASYYKLGVNECINKYKFIQRKPPELIIVRRD